MSTVAPDRRRKIVYVDEAMMFSLLFCNQTPTQFLRLPIAQGLPEGVRIHGVYYEPVRAAFAFVIGHESFEETPPYCQCEVIKVDWEVAEISKASVNSQTIKA
jgi:hypothetical protein